MLSSENYIVLQYKTPVTKSKALAKINSPAMPAGTLEYCIAEASLESGMMTEKFQS